MASIHINGKNRDLKKMFVLSGNICVGTRKRTEISIRVNSIYVMEVFLRYYISYQYQLVNVFIRAYPDPMECVFI